MARKNSQASTTRRWHRSLGSGAAIFILFMVLSGITINHSNELELDQRHVSQPFLLGWYGLDGPELIHSFADGKNWLSFAGSHLYHNGNAVSSISNPVGAVFTDDMLIAAGSAELVLLDHAGKLVERQSWGPPGAGPIESIGLLEDGTVVVKTMNHLWVSDAQMLSWRRSGNSAFSPLWSLPEATPETLRQAINQHYRGDGLSLERLLLDFHSGRVFGPLGILVYDLLALAVGFLAISGLVLWLRSRRNGKRNGKP